MTELSDVFILEKMEEAKEVEFEPQFSLQDLVGKTISGCRQIRNPRKYNPEVESPNPENFDVVLFTDKSFLITKNWGDGECGYLKYYYYDGQKTLYSDQLFGVL